MSGLDLGGRPSACLLLVCASCWAWIPKGATFEGPLATRGETKPNGCGKGGHEPGHGMCQRHLAASR